MADETTPREVLTETREVTIPINDSIMAAGINLGAYVLTGISMPAAWTAANLTFQASPDGVTYQDVYEETGSERVVTAAASREIQLDPSMWAGIRWLKVRSGTASVAVSQAAARTIKLRVRAFD